LIESDEEIANLICELLMVARYQVIWLIDSVSAIKKIEIVQPSIVIVDRKMPDIYHLCHLLKKSSQTQASKVLILNDTPEISVISSVVMALTTISSNRFNPPYCWKKSAI